MTFFNVELFCVCENIKFNPKPEECIILAGGFGCCGKRAKGEISVNYCHV